VAVTVPASSEDETTASLVRRLPISFEPPFNCGAVSAVATALAAAGVLLFNINGSIVICSPETAAPEQTPTRPTKANAVSLAIKIPSELADVGS
jgi:hypothetical protein